MKKTILILSFISLPLTAIATDKSEKMIDTTIDAVVKKFGPSFCDKTIKGLRVTANRIQNCYQQTPKDSNDYEQCILGDEVLTSIIQPMRAISGAMGQPKPLDDMAFYSTEAILNRADEINAYPKYKNFTDKQKTDYQEQSVKAFFDKANASCK